MLWLTLAIVLSAGIPVVLLLLGSRRTTLLSSAVWVCAAWASWTWSCLAPILNRDEAAIDSRIATALTACAGIAVLGARRPGAEAWNFVVLGLLAVFFLPIVQGRGRTTIHPAHDVFLGATLLVGVLNYAPTRAGPAALLLGLGCAASLRGSRPDLAWLCLGAVPWVALALVVRTRRETGPDLVWLQFRDRFGAVWGLRVMEQMNRSTDNAGRAVVLNWFGFDPRPEADSADEAELLRTLNALLKRFTTDDKETP